ncbi:cytotoxic translational repressor of toxin-antitoxin stability system [Candidatus Micrarchaeota archaeon RBG_16_49_10]|nr:MAG: cytotoxic translational repressor of toxin-antitoxin stability system [Candidatus Micrarchaeota archaeon RBG_16_49_10]
MTYSVEFSDLAFKQLKKLEKETQTKVISALERCRIRPYDHVKKVVGTDYYRLKAGKYRVLMRIDGKRLVVFVVAVAYREKIYKNLEG